MIRSQELWKEKTMLIPALTWTHSASTGARLLRDGKPFSDGTDGKLLMESSRSPNEYMTGLVLTGFRAVEAQLKWLD